MLDEVKKRLSRLREAFGTWAEKAYADRDAADELSLERSFAEGESHAYGVAESEVRRLELELEHEVRRAEQGRQRPSRS